MTKFNITMLALAILSAFTMVACGDDEGGGECGEGMELETVQCDAESDEDCSEDGTKEICVETEGLNCAEGEVEGTDADGNPACVPGEGGCAEGEEEVAVECDAASDDECGEDGTKLVCMEIPQHRFVLIQDLSNLDAGGPYPGTDIDAITLHKADGSSFNAATVLDSMSYESDAANPDAVLGAPDATAGEECDANPELFFALGYDAEAELGGYVIVDFEGDDTVIEPGDSIEVHEFGTNCGANRSDDDYTISMSLASEYDGTWEEICQATGKESCEVPGAAAE